MSRICFSESALDGSKTQDWVVPTGTNLKQWLSENGFTELMCRQPLVVILNGAELMECEYDRILMEGDKVALCAQQEGLGLTAIFMIAMTVVSVALYLTMPTPQNPNIGDSEQASPTYSVNARGNFARLGQPRPVLYGKTRVYPDLSSKPYNEYDANGDQYAYQLFEVTQGQMTTDVATWRFEDTLLSHFSNFEYEIIPPGQRSSLFPSVVDVSDEVDNAELIGVLGPYSANEPATETTRIAIDIVCPQGLYYQDNKARMQNHAVSFQTQYREIDNNGNPIGNFVVAGNHRLSDNRRDAIRRTYEYLVPAGRYEVQVTRTTPAQSGVRYGDKIHWTQLRAYVGSTSLTSTTRVAIKIRASEQIGNRALSKFNLVAQRLLPKWNSETGWGLPEATSNPAWAFADACRQNYGGNRSDAYIDLRKCEQFAPVFDAEGVEFNGVFDTKTNLWDALTAILMPARCKQVDNRGVYTFVRDSQQSVPVQMFNMRNIVRDSFRIEHAGVLEETSDSIRAKFYDKEQDYREASFVATLAGGTTNNPRDVDFFGITDEDQVFKLAQYLNAQNFFRRERIKFETGIEGRIPFYGDLVAICHYMTGVERGEAVVSGEIVDFDAGTNVVTLSEPVPAFATPYIVIRDLEGAPTDPMVCTVVGDRKIQINDVGFDPDIIVIEPGYERPYFSFGDGTDFMVLAKVERMSVAGPGRIELECFVDAPEVYTAADGLPVPPITQLPPLTSIVPAVTNLIYEVGGTEDAPIVYLTWNGERADYYEVEYSFDGGQNYYPAADGRTIAPSFEHAPEHIGQMTYRVAGVSILRGGWQTIQVDTSISGPGFAPPGTPTALSLREAFTGPVLKIQWASQTYQNRVEYWRAGVLRLARTVEGSQDDLHGEDAQAADLQRAFDIRVYSISPAGILSENYASLSVSNPAPATLGGLEITGFLGVAKVDFTYPSYEDFVGVSVWASPTPSFTPSNATLVVDRSLDPVIGVPLEKDTTVYMVAAARDHWGTTGLNYSGEYEVTASDLDIDLGEIEETLDDIRNELSSIDFDLSVLEDKFPIGTTDIKDNAIATPKLVANSVVADKIASNAIQTRHLVANAVTAEKLTIGNFTNLIPNGNFKTGDLSDWFSSAGNNSIVQRSAAGVPANAPTEYVLRVDAAVTQITSHGVFAGTANPNAGIELVPGESYTLSADMASSGGNCSILLYGFRADGTQGTIGSFSATPTGAIWQNFWVNITIPAGWSYARAYVYKGAPGPASYVYITNIKLIRRMSGQLIVDGAITAEKVAALAITSAKIAAGAVTADKIEANAVTAGKINVATLSAISANMGSITAGVMTIPPGTGSRLVIDGGSATRLWIGSGAHGNAAGTLLSFNSSTNTLLFRGTLDVRSSTAASRMEVTSQAIKAINNNVVRCQFGNLLV